MKTIFRKAVSSDIDAVERIYNNIHDAEEAGVVTTGWLRGIYPLRSVAEQSLARDDLYVAELIEDGASAGQIVADQNEDGSPVGQIVATAIINQLQVDVYADCDWDYTASDEEVLVLHTLAVDPSHLHCGIGSGFVHYYEALAADMGCTVLRMDTNARNKTARKMYAGLGYREAAVVPTIFNGIPGVDLVLLEKNVK